MKPCALTSLPTAVIMDKYFPIVDYLLMMFRHTKHLTQPHHSTWKCKRRGLSKSIFLPVLYMQKFLPGENLPSVLIGKIVNDYIEDMVTFTTLAEMYSTEYFCHTKVAGLGKILVK